MMGVLVFNPCLGCRTYVGYFNIVVNFILKRTFVNLCRVVLGITDAFYREKIQFLGLCYLHFIAKRKHSIATGYAWGVIATDCLAHHHPGKAQGDLYVAYPAHYLWYAWSSPFPSAQERPFARSTCRLGASIKWSWNLRNEASNPHRTISQGVGIMKWVWGRLWNGMRASVALAHWCGIIVVVYAYFGNTCEYHQIPNCCVHLRDMIKNSKEWARKRGLIQTNEVHGKEEWKIPTERTFSFKNDVTQSVRMHASTTVQDFQGCYGGVHMARYLETHPLTIAYPITCED